MYLRNPTSGYVWAPPPISRTRCEARIVGTARLGREATMESGPSPTLSVADVKPSRNRPEDVRWKERSVGGRWSRSGGFSSETCGRHAGWSSHCGPPRGTA